MLGLLFLIGVLGIVVCAIKYRNNWRANWEIGVAFFFIITLLCLVFILGAVSEVCTEHVIDNKIAMYIEENAAIEEKIDAIVLASREYESSTYKALKSQNSMTLATIYPTLQSNEIVQGQINLYTDNNAQIKELKKQKIDIGYARWWLYFGVQQEAMHEE